MAAPTVGPIAIRRILLATDFSHHSENALSYALALARRFGSELFLTHVVDVSVAEFAADYPPPMPDHVLRDAARESMAALVRRHRLDDVRHTISILLGPVWQELAQSVRKHDVDLAIFGTHGGARKLLSESLVQTAIRHAPCAVLMVGPQAAPAHDFHRVLYVTETGAESPNAWIYALKLAQAEDAKMFALRFGCDEHVQQDESALPLAYPAMHFELLTDPAPSASGPILKVAAQHRADVIVMGVRQVEGISSGLPVSIALDLLDNVGCAVLTVPQ